MKKVFTHLSLVVLILLAGDSLKAQTTVQIGSGNDIPANTLFSPIYKFSATSTAGNTRSAILVTASEMQAASIPSGSTITSIEFNKRSMGSFNSPGSFSIYMRNSTSTSLSSTTTWASITSTFSQVFNSNAYNVPEPAGWVSMNLSTPFLYNGDGLEVAFDAAFGNTLTTGPFQWEYTASVATDLVISTTPTSATPGATLSATTSAYRRRPNIKITYTPPTMPVNLLEFQGSVKHGKVELNWRTTSEAEFSHFVIERSKDGVAFEQIGSVPGKGNTGVNDYVHTDSDILQIAYYRLKLVDKDGKSVYSGIVRIKALRGIIAGIKAYPNPVSDHVTLQVELEHSSPIQVSIEALSGKRVLTKQGSFPEGTSVIPISMNGYAKGFYILRIQTGNENQCIAVLKQ